MTVSIIVARAENGAIGKDNDLIWRLPADLKFFKKTTMGGVMVMGRKTYESIGRPLPGRTTIIVTRNSEYKAEGCLLASSVAEAIEKARELGKDEVFLAGGAQIYEMAMPLADKIYLTEVKATFEADTFFPDLLADDWKEISREDHEADEKNPYAYSFVTFLKK
ncbi:dihydrofolate reductase [Fulvitalea axinellae]|uniref:Dihydrofolate reductase n=1 Tax=Fulvitalea axinellae TaxID=1182444 RepID=A0AAU9CXL2_9BACT|nr:dihydrofolate reductase [Fulvitalea axinellae]